MSQNPSPSPDPQTHTLLFSNTHISIFHNKDHNWLYCRWEGERTLESFVNGSEHILYYLQDTRVHKMILDSSTYQGETLDEIIAGGTEFARQLADAGLEYLAWIFGENSLAQSTADEILAREKTEVVVLNFDNLRLAEIWLRSLN
jgi:hypothetical protein